MKVEPVTTEPTKVFSIKGSDQCLIIYPDGLQQRFSSYYDWRMYLDSKGKISDIPSQDLRRIA